MKKCLTKLLAIVLSVCVLFSTPVVTALAESYCPIESVYLTLHRPLYENVDGYWNDNSDDQYFYYDIEEYLRFAATIHIEYDDGNVENLTLDEFHEKSDISVTIGNYGSWQGEEHWYVGDEVEAYFDVLHEPSNTWIYYDFTTTVEETPAQSITAEPTKSLVENFSGCSVRDEYHFEKYYRYDVALTEPTFTIKWKDSAKADTTVRYADVEKLLRVPTPSFTSDQSYANEWSAGNIYTVTTNLLGVECNFDVTVISSKVVDFSVKATHKAILGVDNALSYDQKNQKEFHEFKYHSFFPEITLTFDNGQSITVDSNAFSEKTNRMYSVYIGSNQSAMAPWNKAGEYNFDLMLASNHDGDFEPLDCTMPVEVVENPIEKLEVVATAPLIKYDSWEQDVYDKEDNYIGSYTHYGEIGNPIITVHYTDGTTVGPIYAYELQKLFNNRYTFSVYTDQSYENQWDLGDHKINFDFMGHHVEYDVILTDSYVKSIKVLDANVSSNDIYYDETGSCYYDLYKAKIEFTLWDDSKYVETVQDGNWCNYGYVEIEYDQETTPWYEGGENEFTVTITDENGEEFTADGSAEIVEYFEFDYYPEDDEIVISGYYGSKSGVLEIPEEIDGYPVVAISDLYSHDENQDLVTGIVIPNSVTSITEYALDPFNNLESIELGSGLTYIPDGLGANNGNLKTLTVSSTNEDYYSVNNAIFTKDKTKLVAVAPACDETIILPAECTDIEVLYRFASAYRNVKIGYKTPGDYCVKENGITYSKDKKTVLACDTDKTGAVVLPNTVTNINQEAFDHCQKITSVTIPNGVTSIVYGTFHDCASLASVTLSSNLKSIGAYAFAECSSLESITLPNSLEGIEYSAFMYSGLKGNLTIPNSVMYLGSSAFSNTQIETVKIGSGMESMSGAFSYIATLKSANVPASVVDFSHTFYDCYNLSSVTLENGLSLICTSAFEGCSSLNAISIPNSVTDIDYYAFRYSGLESITLPDSVEYLGEGAFYGCRDLTSATIGDGVQEIGHSVFSYTGLKDINWGENVQKIEALAFAGAELESVEIPNTVTSILYAAFDGNNNLSSIKIPSSVESVGAHAFDETAWYMAQNRGNTYIDNILYRYKGDVLQPTVVNIKNGTRLIADAAFKHSDPELANSSDYLPDSYYDLSGITKINIPNSVEAIGNLAFCGLPNITELKLPDSLINIGVFPFEFCDNLTTIDIGKSTAHFNIYAFAGAFYIEKVIADPQNTEYTTIDGVLYNKDVTELIYCPPAKTGDLVVPGSVEYVNENAFSYTKLNSIIFQNPDVVIEYGAFIDYEWFYDREYDYCEVYYYGMPETDVVLKADQNSAVRNYAQNLGLNFEAIVSIEEEQTGITILGTTENSIPEGAELVVESVLTSEENTVMFDITLECDGDSVQPNAPVTVTIPLPAGFSPELCKVYRLEDDGTKTDMNATADGSCIYFTTDHFSLYVIEMDRAVVEYAKGDVDGNGVVNLLDLTILNQYLAGNCHFDYIEENLDVNGDGKVNSDDSTALSRLLSGWGEIEIPDLGGSEEEELTKFTPGDIDGNGEINLLDLVTLSRVVAGWEVEHVEAALDPNGDEVCSLLDVVFLARYLSGWHRVLSNVAYSK